MRAVVRRTARPQKADARSSPSRLAARKPKATSMADWMEIKPFSFGRPHVRRQRLDYAQPPHLDPTLVTCRRLAEVVGPILGARRPGVPTPSADGVGCPRR